MASVATSAGGTSSAEWTSESDCLARTHAPLPSCQTFQRRGLSRDRNPRVADLCCCYCLETSRRGLMEKDEMTNLGFQGDEELMHQSPSTGTGAGAGAGAGIDMKQSAAERQQKQQEQSKRDSTTASPSSTSRGGGWFSSSGPARSTQGERI